MSRLLIVIVNYRTAGMAVDCLRSLAPQINDDIRVTITDGLSGDDSVEVIGNAIRENGWHWATLMPLEHNGGFAFGNNQAIRPALASDHPPDFILLLNPDTIVREGAIDALLQFMISHPEVGIAGSRLEDPDGTPQRSAFRFHSIAAEFERGVRFGPVSSVLEKKIVAPEVSDVAMECDWVCGASMMVRREVFNDVGVLDDRYFMYFEETDFTLAAKRAGWKTWYVPESRVVHLVGAASGFTNSKKPPKRRPTYWFDARRRYFVKNHGVLYALAADAAFATGFALWRVRRAIQRKPDSDPPQMLLDFVRNSVFMRGASL